MSSTLPIIAIDFDEVVFPFIQSFIPHHNQTYGTNLTPEHFTSYRFSEVLGHTEEKTDEVVFAYHQSGTWVEHPPFAETLSALQELRRSYRLVIVTARSLDIKQFTLQWVERHTPGVFSDVIFCTERFAPTIGTPKSVICKQIGATALIDDNLEHVIDAAQAGIRGILFGDYPWNQAAELPEGITRAKGWSEACGLLIS